ncbi:excisionase family DNA-binding protein [Sulfobacillus thermotolerans]
MSRWRIYDLIAQNVIPAVRLGRQIRIPRDKLWELIQAQRQAI